VEIDLTWLVLLLVTAVALGFLLRLFIPSTTPMRGLAIAILAIVTLGLSVAGVFHGLHLR
jgi:hypothetical protein